jgi:hypothetical protein
MEHVVSYLWDADNIVQGRITGNVQGSLDVNCWSEVWSVFPSVNTADEAMQ